MVASSVTGTGPGESFGKYKPENNCGCGCVENSPSNTSAYSSKVSNCKIRYNSCKINNIKIKSGSNSIKIC